MRRVKECPKCHYYNGTFESKCVKCKTNISSVISKKVDNNLEYAPIEKIKEDVKQEVKPQTKTCPFCDTENKLKAVVCKKCGKPILNIKNKKSKNKSFTLYSKDITINLSNDPTLISRELFIDHKSAKYISREHAEVFIKDDKLVIKDLDSTNGTFIANDKLEPNKEYEYDKLDKIKFANIQLLVR